MIKPIIMYTPYGYLKSVMRSAFANAFASFFLLNKLRWIIVRLVAIRWRNKVNLTNLDILKNTLM